MPRYVGESGRQRKGRPHGVGNPTGCGNLFLPPLRLVFTGIAREWGLT